MRLTPRRVLVGLLSLSLAVGSLAVLASSAQADPPTPPSHLVIAAVWGANADTAQWTNDWVELYNPTGQDIVLGSYDGTTLTSNYYQCYRSLTATPQKCSTTVGLFGTVEAHHYFLIWDANAHSPADHGTFPAGITPDFDASVKTAANGNQQGSNMGGCNTGGQLLLLSSTTAGAPTFKGDLSSPTAKADGVVDGVGWDNANVNPPDSAETNGATPITGVPAGTNNACVIARTFTNGVPVDTDTNRTDFTPVSPATFTLHSQISDQVAVAPVSDAAISVGAAMTPIQVQGSKGIGALTYAATGLPDGVTIDPGTGIISGTPSAGDALQGYPVTVTVTDSTPTEAETATTSFTLTLSNQLVVQRHPERVGSTRMRRSRPSRYRPRAGRPAIATRPPACPPACPSTRAAATSPAPPPTRSASTACSSASPTVQAARRPLTSHSPSSLGRPAPPVATRSPA